VNLRWFWLPILSFGLVNSAAADTADPDRLLFCFESNSLPPYTLNSELASSSRKGVKLVLGQHGIMVDLVIKASERIGHQALFITRPWKRCILQLEKGSVDGIFAAIWQPEREQWGDFPKANGQVDPKRRLWTATYPIYTYYQSQLHWDGKQFDQLRTGLSAPLGYVATAKLKQLQAFSHSTFSAPDGLQIVARGRLDGYIVEQRIGDQMVAQLGLDSKVKKLPTPFLTEAWYLPLSHQWTQKHPDKAQAFWRAIADERKKIEASLPVPQ
jgi:polar amino acid transport system substrate-binding protein